MWWSTNHERILFISIKSPSTVYPVHGLAKISRSFFDSLSRQYGRYLLMMIISSPRSTLVLYLEHDMMTLSIWLGLEAFRFVSMALSKSVWHRYTYPDWPSTWPGKSNRQPPSNQLPTWHDLRLPYIGKQKHTPNPTFCQDSCRSWHQYGKGTTIILPETQ